MCFCRLEAYDRNLDFRGPAIILPPVHLPAWPTSGFKQLQSCHREILPDISLPSIEGYFVYRRAIDNLNAGDIKGITKGRLLLESERVEAGSFTQSNNKTEYFFTAIVAAAMKKKVSYSVKVKVTQTGEILNSDCECPAGKGPHGSCKHVAALLLMLQALKETGQLLLKNSCTENLQTFHKPAKRHDGTQNAL